jgi:hypothetical protein
MQLLVTTNSQSLRDVGKTLVGLVAQDYSRRAEYEDDYTYPPQVSVFSSTGDQIGQSPTPCLSIRGDDLSENERQVALWTS